MANKLKLNDEVIDEICKYMSNGLSNKDVCKLIGVSEPCFYGWINEGTADLEEGKSNIKVKLVKSLKKAESQFKLYHLNNIMKSSKKDWKASAWVLERRFPEEYGRIDRNKVDFEDDVVPIQIINDVPTDK